jgi:hypothetical protein
MAAWRRTSGDVTVTLSFDDRANEYKARVCARGNGCEKVSVGLPRHLKRGHSVDHPMMISNAARAAISFSRDSIQERANWGDRGPIVKKPRRKRK